MRSFETLFPGFIDSCMRLHDQIVPAAMVILVLSFAFFFWSGPPHPMELVKHLTKLFLIVLLITNADTLINQGKTLMEDFVQQNVSARPDNVAQRYKDKLAAEQNNPELKDKSWWAVLFSADFFEAIIYAVLLLISWLATALLFYISLLQKAVLQLCWVLSPILFACFAIPVVSGLALRHVLRIVGILFWDLGLALAATITDGLLDLQTHQSFVAGGAALHVLTNLLAIATVALWIVFSSVLAPGVMQRLIAGSSGPANLISQAASLLANTGWPLLAAFLSHRSSGIRPFTRPADNRPADSPNPPLISVPELPPGSPQDPPHLRPIGADDATADKAVRQVLDESTRN